MGEERRQGEMDHQATSVRPRHRDPRCPPLVSNTKETRRRRAAVSIAADVDTRRKVRFTPIRVRHQLQSAEDLSISRRPRALRFRQVQRRHQLPQRSFHASHQLQHQQDQRDLHQQRLRGFQHRS